MAKVFRPSSRESRILSRIESSRERTRRLSIQAIREQAAPMSNAIASKLVEEHLVETVSKNSLEEQILMTLEEMLHMDDFDIDFKVAPFRNLVSDANIVSLYVTAFVIETMIDHKDVIDIFGSDDEIYHSINRQVNKFISVS
ncbi:MAG: hypothetical protein CSA22_06535 [Deltaproteobacteria bacterium]|nr:MAG: hypothetical protein CSA22_06535 [Deltaproteobacteria bacterium]